jgi:hypothetical protein
MEGDYNSNFNDSYCAGRWDDESELYAVFEEDILRGAKRQVHKMVYFEMCVQLIVNLM